MEVANERTVNEYVDLLKERRERRIVADLFDRIAGVAPDVVAAFPDFTCQPEAVVDIAERIATRERHVKLFLVYDLHYLFKTHIASAFEIP